jgi:hypothetical protein
LQQDYYRHEEDDKAMISDKLKRQVNTTDVGHLRISMIGMILSNNTTGLDVRINLTPKFPGRPVFCTQTFIVYLIQHPATIVQFNDVHSEVLRVILDK